MELRLAKDNFLTLYMLYLSFIRTFILDLDRCCYVDAVL